MEQKTIVKWTAIITLGALAFILLLGAFCGIPSISSASNAAGLDTRAYPRGDLLTDRGIIHDSISVAYINPPAEVKILEIRVVDGKHYLKDGMSLEDAIAAMKDDHTGVALSLEFLLTSLRRIDNSSPSPAQKRN